MFDLWNVWSCFYYLQHDKQNNSSQLYTWQSSGVCVRSPYTDHFMYIHDTYTISLYKSLDRLWCCTLISGTCPIHLNSRTLGNDQTKKYNHQHIPVKHAMCMDFYPLNLSCHEKSSVSWENIVVSFRRIQELNQLNLRAGCSSYCLGSKPTNLRAGYPFNCLGSKPTKLTSWLFVLLFRIQTN